MRDSKLILYIALSVDGYIADPEGRVDWLEGEEKNDTGDHGYGRLIQEIDTIILGYNTYHQIATELSPGKWPYKGLMTYVLTHHKEQDQEEIKFVNEPPEELLRQIKGSCSKHIWLCGGAQIIGQFLEKDLIDDFRLTFIPTLLGIGIRLFDRMDHRTKLHLVSAAEENGMVDCCYQR